jgi:TPR repeat protein
VTKDESRAFQLFMSAAAQGNARAQRWVAAMFEEGKGTAQDLAQSYHYMKLAANQGDATAQFRLGQWYRTGACDRLFRPPILSLRSR